MNATSMLFHDYETFGVDPRKDRPAQFAAIRTDLNLNIIGDPIMIYCKPAPDHLPDPIACMITGITPQICMQHGLSEAEFASRVLSELGADGTIGLGYNTINFDDEVTRFMLWRNLHEPYGREWRNGCSRWDLINVARAAHALRPEGINWPTNEKGKISFKLEDLTKANGLTHEAAHDALSDVYATISLAKLIRDTNPKLFNYFLELRNKNEVARHVNMANPKPFIHITGGADNGGVAIMMPIASHPTNKNEIIAWNLAHDPAELAELDAETIKKRLFTRSDELPAGVTRLPIRKITTNKCPAIVGNLAVLTDQRASEINVDKQACLINAEKVFDILQRTELNVVFREVYKQEKTLCDIDEDLYSGFVSNNDRIALDRVRDKLGATTEACRFEDERLHELVLRYKARNNSAYLTAVEAEEWKTYLHEKLVVGRFGSRTFDTLKQSIEDHMVNAPDKQKAILSQLSSYAEKVKSDLSFFNENSVMPLEHHQWAHDGNGVAQVRQYKGMIEQLHDNEVFVFGSNRLGINGNAARGTGGAAFFALQNGWVRQREVLDNCMSSCGKAWGLCTVTVPGRKRSMTPVQIKDGVRILYEHAWNNPHLDYLVAYKAKARNLNGYSSEEMAEMFSAFPIPPNLVFEESFALMLKPLNGNFAADMDTTTSVKRRANRP